MGMECIIFGGLDTVQGCREKIRVWGESYAKKSGPGKNYMTLGYAGPYIILFSMKFVL